MIIDIHLFLQPFSDKCLKMNYEQTKAGLLFNFTQYNAYIKLDQMQDPVC